jgi:hypothetical protein
MSAGGCSWLGDISVEKIVSSPGDIEGNVVGDHPGDMDVHDDGDSPDGVMFEAVS